VATVTGMTDSTVDMGVCRVTSGVAAEEKRCSSEIPTINSPSRTTRTAANPSARPPGRLLTRHRGSFIFRQGIAWLLSVRSAQVFRAARYHAGRRASTGQQRDLRRASWRGSVVLLGKHDQSILPSERPNFKAKRGQPLQSLTHQAFIISDLMRQRLVFTIFTSS
jgi:hypothetical protein